MQSTLPAQVPAGKKGSMTALPVTTPVSVKPRATSSSQSTVTSAPEQAPLHASASERSIGAVSVPATPIKSSSSTPGARVVQSERKSKDEDKEESASGFSSGVVSSMGMIYVHMYVCMYAYIYFVCALKYSIIYLL
jgi:hypothetical protein